LNVPVSRLQPNQGGFNLGRSAEITRDEVKFTKFVGRLRRRFSHIFMKALEKQLVLKGIVAEEDWSELANLINFDFTIDNHFEEFKEAEVLQNRIQLLNQVTPFIGRYYSDMWVRKNVLHQSEEEIAEMMDEMGEEKVPMMAPTPEGMDKAPAPIANRPDTQNDMQQQQQPGQEPQQNVPAGSGVVPGKGQAY
jgi:hypothetical protein